MTERVLLLNAYSAGNHGDKLLVDVAIELISEAFGDQTVVTVCCTNPESYSYLPPAHSAVSAYRGRRRKAMALSAAAALLSGGRVGLSRKFVDAAREADLVISVGGAYLRGGHLVELVKSTLVHGPQLALASEAATPWILLPVSVGPYGPSSQSWIARRLSRALCVYLRDDVSAAEFGNLDNAVRVPDSAIIALSEADRCKPRVVRSGRVGLVLRELRNPGTFEQQVYELWRKGIEWVPALQSSYSANNDLSYYKKALGITPRKTLEEHLQAADLGAVVSVRLHGALRSIMLGVPAVHLSYERKGYSAFRDLGLEPYVLDARDFDAEEVTSKVRQLQEDPADYWGRVEKRLSGIGQARRAIIRSLQAAHE
jgi:polysaccharide pyruvyl transferase WcaK-like protein